MEFIKNEFSKFNISDKIRCYRYVEEEINKIKQENPKNYSSMLCYVKNPEKVKKRIYKRRDKLKGDKKTSAEINH